MQKFRFTLNHDHGSHKIQVTAKDEKTARMVLMKYERCPERAILKTEKLEEEKA